MYAPVISQRFRGAALAALGVLLTTAAAWLWAHEGHQPLASHGFRVDLAAGRINLGAEARRALDVQTAAIRLQDIDERLVAPATIAAPWQRYAYATSRIEGKVTAIHVRPGQAVQAGQPLADVESLELENLQLELRTADNDVRLAAENLAQLEAAAGRGAARVQELAEAEVRHQESRNILEIARRKLLSLGLDDPFLARLLREPTAQPLRTLPILSPIGGEVVHADVQIGQVIQPSDHLIDVVDLSEVWVQVSLLERDWPRVEVGQRIELRLAADPSAVLRGTVAVKGLALDPQTHQATVWAAIEETGRQGEKERLLPGMYGQATVFLPGRKKAKTVPTAAVIRDGAERYVLVEEGPGQYARRNVVVGAQGNGWVEIKGGDLPPLYPVVTVGAHELATLLPQGVLRLSKEAEKNTGVRTEPVGRQRIARMVSLPGTVDLWPNRRALVAARLPGTIQRVRVDRSQPVVAGQVVAEVASLELQSLQLELLRQHLQAELLEGSLKRLRPLASGAFTPRKLRETESAYHAARQRCESLQRKLEAVGLSAEQVRDIRDRRKLVELLPVRAPIAGVVISFAGKLGQYVKAEDPLFEIHDLGRPVIRGHVSQRDLPFAQEGRRAHVRLGADPGYRADGVVIRTGQVIGSADRTLAVWVDVPPLSAQPLLYGMMARLTLLGDESEPVRAVRREAVLREGSRAYVFVRQHDGIFARRAVTTGRSDDEWVEITQGLDEGERVAVHGVAELETGYASLK